MHNIPNILTLGRILVIPILIMSFFLDGVISNWVAAFLFILASVTDFFDGYLARVLKAESNFGRVLDPIADKLLVATAVVMLVHFEHDIYITIPGIIIIFRELFVSGWREYLAGINVSVPVTTLAKWKTGMQMTSLSLLILGDKGLGVEYVNDVGRAGLIIAAILTIITGYAYFREGFKHL